MSIIGEVNLVERLQFFDGQRLFASDLQALETLNREMRWLHNQSLHQPGVGSGYAVGGQKGGREVTVQPGYAIDSCGREIVLTQPAVIAIPPVASDDTGAPVTFDLTVSYPSDDDLKASETREGICQPRGVVRLQEAPTLCWVRLNAELQPVDPRLRSTIQTGLKILLARIEVLNCQLNKPVSSAERRNARPPQLPYVACGATDPDDTRWRFWTTRDGRLPRQAIGLFIPVDTSSARFRTTPNYIVQLVGDRAFVTKRAMRLNGDEPFALDGFVQVVNPQPDRFVAHVFMPPLRAEGAIAINPQRLFSTTDRDQLDRVSSALRLNRWHLTWIGVEA